MARIGHNVPLTAYDHIAGLLKNSAGKDGLVSRDDADALVSKLRTEGRGTEALAAQNLFKMIDNFDNKDGARVTGFDLDLSRGFVEQKMLENRDTNNNGFSAAEVEQMSPTARALIELGQALGIKGTQGRVAHRVPEQGAEHVAALILKSAGADGIISRSDAEAMMDDLLKQGRGTEHLAAERFFNFADGRDAAPGARVTGTDVADALAYIKKALPEHKDLNGNGYSAAEIEQFPTTGKAFLLVGQMIDAGIIKTEA